MTAPQPTAPGPDGSWLLDLFPSMFSQSGPAGLTLGQWLALAIAVVGGWVLGSVASRITRSLLGRLVSRTETSADDAVLERIGGPLTLMWSTGMTRLMLPWVALRDSAYQLAARCLVIASLVGLFWALERSIEVARRSLGASKWALERPGTRSLLQLAARAGHILVFAVALVVVLSELGYPVASLVAGLGIGGLAVALAAQKTLENLFGAFALATDQPFREGDFVRVDDLLGTVESIGLRSTRLRTLDRTLVSIPNGKLADMRLETFAARDRLRFACTIGLSHRTTADQIRSIVAGFNEVLRSHEKLWTESVTVSFVAVSDSSFNIEVGAWFTTTNWDEFLVIRSGTLLRFMEVIEKAGAVLATPARRVTLMQDLVQDEPQAPE